MQSSKILFENIYIAYSMKTVIKIDFVRKFKNNENLN